jgi:group I intron endonuclease
MIDMVKGYIYRHWIINDKGIEKSYVGKTIQDVKDRWGYSGKRYLRNRKSKFAHAIKKYGWDNFHHDIILAIECETVEELDYWLKDWERYYIWKYDSFENGYNHTLGGEGCLGYTHSDETRQLMTEQRKGRTASEETKKRQSTAHRGVIKNGTKVICIDTQEIFISAMQAAKQYNTTNVNIIKCCREQMQSTGIDNDGKRLRWMYYDEWQKLSKEEQDVLIHTKYKKRHKTPRKVICIETEEVFNSPQEAAEHYNISRTSVYNSCMGRLKNPIQIPNTNKKLTFKYRG